MMSLKNQSIVICLAIVIVPSIFLSGCIAPSDDSPASRTTDTVSSTWMDIELTDVATQETFTISDFKGTPILLDSFAVWCPTCLQQQRKMAELKERKGAAIIHISLDTDPNEDENNVKEHIETHGLDWYFAISPIELTNALIEEFGLQVVNAPSAPVVLICEDGSARLLTSGVKSADELLAAIDEGC